MYICDDIEVIRSNTLIEYRDAIDIMETIVSDIISGTKSEMIWLLEHYPVYTAGTSAKQEDLINDATNIPIYKSSRGGKYTCHSPGQRMVYFMLNLKKRSKQSIPDVRKYIYTLESIIIDTISNFGITGLTYQDRIGVWVNNNGSEQKIAAIGVRFIKGVTMHGIAVNINNDLSLFNNIIPCGISNYGVCSLQSLGVKCTMEEFDNYLLKVINEKLVNYTNI